MKPQRCQSFLVLLLTIFLMSAGWSQPQPLATLLTTVPGQPGQLEVQRAGTTNATPLSLRDPLFSGDVARTSAQSKAGLRLMDGSQVLLNSNTVVQFTRPVTVGGGRRSFFRLLRGDAFIRTQSALAVRTVSATAAVRGTAFQLSVDAADTTTLRVYEGTVDFFSAYDAVVVRAGQQSRARLGMRPTHPDPSPETYTAPGWLLELDRALLTESSTADGTRGEVDQVIPATQVQPRKKSFWKRVLLPALVIGGLAVIINNRNDSDDSPSRQPTPSTGGG